MDPAQYATFQAFLTYSKTLSPLQQTLTTLPATPKTPIELEIEFLKTQIASQADEITRLNAVVDVEDTDGDDDDDLFPSTSVPQGNQSMADLAAEAATSGKQGGANAAAPQGPACGQSGLPQNFEFMTALQVAQSPEFWLPFIELPTEAHAKVDRAAALRTAIMEAYALSAAKGEQAFRASMVLEFVDAVITPRPHFHDRIADFTARVAVQLFHIKLHATVNKTAADQFLAKAKAQEWGYAPIAKALEGINLTGGAGGGGGGGRGGRGGGRGGGGGGRGEGRNARKRRRQGGGDPKTATAGKPGGGGASASAAASAAAKPG